MHTRADFTELCSQLNFNRENIHTLEKKTKDSIPLAISLINNTTLKHGDHRTEFYAKLCKQLGIYFLFHAREHKTAQRYLAKYHELSIGETFDHAEACNLKGIANIIDNEYKENFFFEVALHQYEELLKQENNNVHYLIGKASALRHISLMTQRQGKLEEAQSTLKQAIEVQKTYHGSVAGQMDTADALHILSLILIQQKKYDEAEKKLLEALSIWESLSKQTGNPSTLMHAAMQTCATVLRLQDKHEEAKKMLHQIYISQVTHHKKETHADIANTLQHIGEATEEMQQIDEAYSTYKQSLDIKLKLQYTENSVPLQVTQDSISRILKKLNPTEKKSTAHFWKEKTKQPSSSAIASEHACKTSP